MKAFYEEYAHWTAPGQNHVANFTGSAGEHASSGLKYIAYYLPQFHAIPENDQ